MGKRELLIILGFVVAGIVAYRLTMPGDETGGGFSVEAIVENLSRVGRRERATASATRRGTIPAAMGLTQLRLTGIARVVVIGEARPDVAYDMTTEVDARDQAGAREAADRAVLAVDEAGAILTLSPRSVPHLSFTAILTVRVPQRLQVRVEGARKTDISGVSGVTLARLMDEATITNVSGAVTGSHRNGELTVSDVGSVDLSLVESRAHVSNVAGPVRLSARNGESRLDGRLGAVAIEIDGHRTVVVGPASGVHVTGVNGGVRVENPTSDVRVDARRVEVAVVLDMAVPVTVFSTERSIELQVDPQRGVTIDARAEDGTIVATDLGLSPEITAGTTTLHQRFGDAAQIALRNQRGEIVIARRKW